MLFGGPEGSFLRELPRIELVNGGVLAPFRVFKFDKGAWLVWIEAARFHYFLVQIWQLQGKRIESGYYLLSDGLAFCARI
jgi:hypothetical protein